MSSKLKTYIIGILIPLGMGALAALLTAGNMDIYQSITKPPLAPPGFLFPVVWAVLYALMGIGSVMIYYSRATDLQARGEAFLVYALQLMMNFLWSQVFFNRQAFLLSLAVLVILWVFILLMIIKFNAINRRAALLQIPCLVWVTFAGYLNLMIYLLN